MERIAQLLDQMHGSAGPAMLDEPLSWTIALLGVAVLAHGVWRYTRQLRAENAELHADLRTLRDVAVGD